MKGDIINVEEHHRRAAKEIVDRFSNAVVHSPATYCFSVSGESGSGKSETGKALADAFEERGIPAFVFQQDDYFLLPPKSNDARRRKDIAWVGTGEVNIDLLDEHMAEARRRVSSLTKPLVIYDEDRIATEEVDLSGYRVCIAEGTYTALLQNVDTRIFIARNRLETLESRKRRAREPIEPFLEQVLEIEHKLISPHRDLADVIISRDFDVTFVAP
jgi:uridine kinase